MKSIVEICAVSLLAFSCVSAVANIEVGADAKLKYQTVDGKIIDLERLHGKIVVVDFWATWCGPCMQEAPHMVELNKKYGGKGLKIFGISLDEDRAKMLAVAKEKGFTWPQYFDGLVWKNRLMAQWGHHGIPFTVLINPLGKVVYAGHPAAGLEKAINETFEKTPPQAVDPKTLSEATKILESAEGRVSDNDPVGAMRLYRSIPTDAAEDAGFVSKCTDLENKIEAAGEKAMTDADSLISAGRANEAAVRLRSLAENLAGLPVALKAKAKILSLSASDPGVRVALEKQEKADRDAEHQTHAMESLAAAEKLLADRQFEPAYRGLKQTAEEYPDTKSGLSAANKMQSLAQSHPEVIQATITADDADKAKGMLSFAASYKRSGRTDLARARYQNVIAKYPGTVYAEEAKEALVHLDN